MSNMQYHQGGYVDTLGALTSAQTDGLLCQNGAYSEVIAATAREYQGFWIDCMYQNMQDASENPGALSVSIGAGGAEQEILQRLKLLDYSSQQSNAMPIPFIPLRVPRGVRLAAKMFDLSAGKSCRLVLHMANFNPLGDKRGFGLMEVLGQSPSTLRGVSCDPGATANLKGAWAEVIATTVKRYRAIMLVASSNNNTGSASWASERIMFDIGIGAGGSEQVIVSNITSAWCFSNSMYVLLPNYMGPFPCDIPAGSRISVRAQSSWNGTGRSPDVTLYGFVQ